MGNIQGRSKTMVSTERRHEAKANYLFFVAQIVTMQNWVDINGYEGVYRISDTGIVMGYAGIYNGRTLNERVIVGQIDRNGYNVVQLHINGSARKKVHRLVAEHFIPNPFNYPVVNHKNGIKTDNNVNNLEWVTSSYNNIHAFKTGLRRMPCLGDHCKAKVIIDINSGVFYESIRELSTLLGTPHKTLSNWLNNKRSNKTSYIFC
jgi:hypothetical protein